MDAAITYMGEPRRVVCDEVCKKAWGVANRPYVTLSDNPDDMVFLADDELGIAPVDPGTYEGGDAKPVNKQNIPNKWCVRQCERCVLSERGELTAPLDPPDWSKRMYNISPE